MNNRQILECCQDSDDDWAAVRSSATSIKKLEEYVASLDPSYQHLDHFKRLLEEEKWEHQNLIRRAKASDNLLVNVQWKG